MYVDDRQRLTASNVPYACNQTVAMATWWLPWQLPIHLGNKIWGRNTTSVARGLHVINLPHPCQIKTHRKSARAMRVGVDTELSDYLLLPSLTQIIKDNCAGWCVYRASRILVYFFPPLRENSFWQIYNKRSRIHATFQ